jgi:hypothetical protein
MHRNVSGRDEKLEYSITSHHGTTIPPRTECSRAELIQPYETAVNASRITPEIWFFFIEKNTIKTQVTPINYYPMKYQQP